VRNHSASFGHNLCWDHAPGTLIVQEAGGIVTDMNGKEYDFTLGERMSGNIGVLASSSVELHKKAVELMKAG
jgi:3'(2'), 5'-bisphosphate nucleotidase